MSAAGRSAALRPERGEGAGGRTIADEWSDLVTSAVVGTDRHPLATPGVGWDVWGAGADPAVALLDRAAAVVAARRAGVLPEPPCPPVAAAPPDARPPCPPAAVARVQRLLRGEHDVLLPEWLHRCHDAGMRPAWVVLPGLLLRGRRDAPLDALVRLVAGPRATWLAEQVPELGVRGVAAVPRSGPVPPVAMPAQAADSAATAAAIVQTFVDRVATWAAAPQLRLLVAALDPDTLPPLVASVAAVPFDPAVERTRADLLSFAEFRHAMVLELRPGRTQDRGTGASAHGGGRSAGERVYGGDR